MDLCLYPYWGYMYPKWVHKSIILAPAKQSFGVDAVTR
jgi:hypothetical protein